MSIKVLIVEDEVIVAMDISHFINGLGYEVVGMASEGTQAQKMAQELVPDVILMDINIKGTLDGIEVASKIREASAIPIIYVTAYLDDITIERAVETNPAAYLVKPFNKQELQATLKIATKRNRRHLDDARILRGDMFIDDEFSFDSVSRQLICCGTYVHLTQRELQLLELLIDTKQNVLSFYELENSIWPDKSVNESTRRALVSRLRAKLKHQFITTLPSQGYRFNS